MATWLPTYQTLTTVQEFRKAVNNHFSKQINEGQEYDARDIKRFDDVDDYARMFIQHLQYGKTFDEQKAFRIFHETMTWRKQNKVYDISTDLFPANYFDRHAIYFQNHDMNNIPLLHYVIRVFHKGQEDNEAVKRFITYNFEEHIRTHPGQRIVILFDLRETGLSHLDYDLIKFVVNSLMHYYPGLLAYMLVYKQPFILQGETNTVCTIIHKTSLVFYNTSHCYFLHFTSLMASSIPTFQHLISVNRFRELVNKHFEKQIDEGQLYDPRDLQRFNEIDEYTMMFIRHGQFGATFDEDRAMSVFNASLSWRKEHHVYDISPEEFPANYFDRNAIYFKNHDMNNNPLLHFVVRTFNKGQEDNEAVKRFITYNFERHIRRHPGQTIVILFDMSETGLKHLDYDLVKFVIGCGQIYYPGLLAYMLIFKMPFILTAAWKIIRSWLPTEAEQFIKFVDAKSITQYVPTDQLSTSMGGTDATNYVHIHDPINDAVEDSMNANSKKKVTFADTGLLDLPLSSETLSNTVNHLPKVELSPMEDPLTPEEPAYSLITTEASLSTVRKSILQKPSTVNGFVGEEKVFHGLAIRPHDELIFERIDPPPHGTADCIQTIMLTNTGDKLLTFKIKTTSPDKFRVKPGCSLLHPGETATINVYLLKAYCTLSSDINKEKFLIIWTLISQEFKQAQLVEFWKHVSSSALYEHRLKCAFENGRKTPSASIIKQSDEISPTRLSPTSPDSSLSEMQKILKESITLQKTTMAQTSRDLQRIQNLLLIIFGLLIVILLWDMYKHFFSFSSPSSSIPPLSKPDL
ncbi:unnamed protein product [Adineta ricciae]|uniref:Motile sperm domain-containing protein 2 n=2 Tax=Adineta ricciae TaxID=249248 RepID=A0A813R5F2_ADIRI|nr:unnamed protein product [Adineta ricciae]